MKIQKTVKYEPLSVKIEVSRKSGAPLNKYFISIGNVQHYFDEFYFVPTYNENQGDYSILKFTAKFTGGYFSSNYPIQCEWNFGNGEKITISDRATVQKLFNTGSTVYHKFDQRAPSVNEQILVTAQPVTFTVLDKVGRRSVFSTTVYPKPEGLTIR